MPISRAHGLSFLNHGGDLLRTVGACFFLTLGHHRIISRDLLILAAAVAVAIQPAIEQRA